MLEKKQLQHVHITTFGCQMNMYDSIRLSNILTKNNFITTKDIKIADLIIVITCSVRKKAELKFYSYLDKLRKLKTNRPKLLIGVGGCIAQQEGQRLLNNTPYLDLVFGTQTLEKVPELIEEIQLGQRITYTPNNSKQKPLTKQTTYIKSKLKSMVTIMTGCNNFCSYCVVPYVKGHEHSRPATEIIQEITELTTAGTREITLLGQNVNSYHDTKQNLDFADLLKRLTQIPKLWRLRFSTSHPKDLSLKLIEAISNLDKVMEQLHLPAQSGSNCILKTMKRGYTNNEYLKLINQLRQQIPKISLGGDIIVGFPGESKNDFIQNLNFIKKVNYDFLFSFLYSERPFTMSSQLRSKLKQNEISKRLQHIQSLQRNISLKQHQALVGSTVEVLVEGTAKHGQGLMSGRERGGRVVNFKGENKLKGSLVWIKINEGLVNSLKGDLIRLVQKYKNT